MATTIGAAVSRVRILIKATKEDAFITDRFIYSLILKYGKTLIRRQDNENKIKMMRSLFETYPCVDLEEVNKVEACCSGIKSDCTIMRTKEKLPAIMEGSFGPIIRGVSSIDNSTYLNPTTPQIFVSIANSTNYKYNKAKYYWYMDGRIYLPNVPWEAINIEAMWEDSISMYKCDSPEQCKPRQDELTPIPDYLFGEIEQYIMRDIIPMLQTPVDPADDKISILR